MKALKSLLLLFVTVFTAGQLLASEWSVVTSRTGNGNVVKQERSVGSFYSISASSAINVYLFQSDEEKVIVEADDNLLDIIVTEVRNGCLKCTVKGQMRNAKKLNVYVSFKNLEEVSASSASGIYSETVIKASNFEINASSASHVKLELDVKNLDAEASSASDIVLVGTCTHFEAESSSASGIDGRKLVAISADLSASSAGNIHIDVRESLEASASSGAYIGYSGKPSHKDVRNSSGGTVSAE